MSRQIRIRQPLPLDVSANLLQAIGVMYPDATIAPAASGDMVIDLGTRTARPSKKRLREEMVGPIDGIDAEASLTKDGLTVFTPNDCWQELAQWAFAVLSAHQDAVNYVEQAVTTPDGRRLAVTACWSKDQTPHSLRLAAEARAERAEAELKALEEAR